MRINYLDLFLLFVSTLIWGLPAVYVIMMGFWVLFFLDRNRDQVVEDWHNAVEWIKNFSPEDFINDLYL